MSGSFEPQGSVEIVETMGRGNAKVHCNGVPLLWGTLGLSGGSFPCRPKWAKSYHLESAPVVHFRFMESAPVVQFPFWALFPFLGFRFLRACSSLCFVSLL